MRLSHVRPHSKEGDLKVGRTFLSARLAIPLRESRQKKSSRRETIRETPSSHVRSHS